MPNRENFRRLKIALISIFECRKFPLVAIFDYSVLRGIIRAARNISPSGDAETTVLRTFAKVLASICNGNRLLICYPLSFII